MGGTRQREALNVLFENWDSVEIHYMLGKKANHQSINFKRLRTIFTCLLIIYLVARTIQIFPKIALKLQILLTTKQFLLFKDDHFQMKIERSSNDWWMVSNMDDNALIFILNYAFSINVGFTLTDELPPDSPSFSLPQSKRVFVNMNWQNKKAPYQTA